MSYRLMRFSKYLDAIKANKPFVTSSFKSKYKILKNILLFYLEGKKLILHHKPITAQIEPTSLCNLKCEMCIRDKIGVPIGTMKFEDFKIILNKLDCLFKIHLSGQGEPFMAGEFFKMVKYANKKGILVNTNTNASLLTKEKIEEICKIDLGEIAVSIESTRKEMYEKIRKGAKFENVIENIKNLVRRLKERRKKTIVSFAVTVLRENIDELTEFTKLAKRIGIKKIIVQTLQEKEDYTSKYTKETKEQRTSDLLREVKNKMEMARINAKREGINLVFDEGKSDGCLWPWRGIYITWNGNVTACCKILDYRKPIMGNLLKEKFWKVWNGKEYQTFRKLLRERKAPFPCIGCNRV